MRAFISDQCPLSNPSPAYEVIERVSAQRENRLREAITGLLAIISILLPRVLHADGVQKVHENPQGYETGLSFRSHESNKDQRTSLDLTSEGEFRMKDYLLVEFDARIRSESVIYGYIYKIEVDGRSIYMLHNNAPYASLKLYYNRRIVDQRMHGQDGADFFRWSRYRLEFIASDNAFRVLHNGVEVVDDEPLALGRKHGVKVVFGADYAPGRVTYDVAPVEVRSVVVSTSREKPTYVWPLETHFTDGNIYDTLQGRAARVLNPNWLIDSHIKWAYKSTTDFPSVVFPVPVGGRMLMLVSASEVSCYDMSSDSVVWRKEFAPALPVAWMNSQFIWDAARERLMFFDFNNKMKPVMWFDAVRGAWSGQYARRGHYAYLHNNRIFLPYDSSLLQLFGYGMHRYRSNVYRLLPDGQVMHYDLSSMIPPRYLSAVAAMDSILYIYGGVGNLSGKQEFGTEVFNDLYTLDLRDYKATLLWNKATTSDSEVAAGTLQPLPETGSLQGLFFCPSRYASYLVLKEFNISSGEFRLLGDTIPYLFHDISSTALLAADSAERKLYALTLHKLQQGGYRMNIYSIVYPGFRTRQVILNPPAVRWNKWYIAACAGVLLAAGATLLLLLGRRRLRTENIQLDEEAIRTTHEQARTLRTRPGIYLLGNFGVVDANGRDITTEFTPMMRQILIFVILYTEQNGYGASNAQLKETFWWDKSEESMRNNRNVNIRKIRLLLETVGGLEIATNSHYWKISYSGKGYCDWIYAMRYMDKVAASPHIALRCLSGLLQIVFMGHLLPGEAFEWLDEHKSRYSDKVVELLGTLRDGELFATSLQAQMLISEGILLFDSLDEESVKAKCRALVALGRIGEAKKRFDRFGREYSRMMGEAYPCTFEKLFHT